MRFYSYQQNSLAKGKSKMRSIQKEIQQKTILLPVLILTFFLILAVFAESVYADSACPKGKSCTTPGCHLYTDSNGNSLCDLAEGVDSNAQEAAPLPDANSEANTSDAEVANPDTTESSSASERLPVNILIPVYSGFLVLATILAKWKLSKKRRDYLRTVLLFLSLGILGFFFGGCICPIGGLQNLPLKLAGVASGSYLNWLLIMLLPILFLLVAGRVFCSSVCPMGAVQELLFKVGGVFHLNKGKPGLSKVKWIRFIKYPVLAWLIVFTALTGYTLFCGNDPFLTLFTLQGSIVSLVLLVSILISSLFFSRLWCRAICPYGALLGIISGIASLMHLRTTPGGGDLRCNSCSGCGSCARECPVDAITVTRAQGEAMLEIDPFECINCKKCVDKN